MDELINDCLRDLERCHHHLFHFGGDGGMLQTYNEVYETLDQVRTMEVPSEVKEKIDNALAQFSIDALNAKVREMALDEIAD
jgi:hypothetical protein